MAPSYKLVYFGVRARAELIRWEFAYAGQEFEDVRVEHADWPTLKPTTPFGQLPYLEVDGKALAQTYSIARYIARKHGLAGQTAWEEAEVDSLVDYVGDSGKGYYTWLTTVFSGDQKKADTLKEEYLTTGVVPYLQGLERLLQSNDGGKGFFVGTKPTWGDFAVTLFVSELKFLKPDVLAKYPLLEAHASRVTELKGIKEWIKKRPETPF